MSYLQRLGAKAGFIQKISSIDDVVKILPIDGSVVMIAVHVMKKGKVSSFGSWRYGRGEIV